MKWRYRFNYEQKDQNTVYASKYGLVSFRLVWIGMRVVKHRLALVPSYTPMVKMERTKNESGENLCNVLNKWNPEGKDSLVCWNEIRNKTREYGK